MSSRPASTCTRLECWAALRLSTTRRSQSRWLPAWPGCSRSGPARARRSCGDLGDDDPCGRLPVAAGLGEFTTARGELGVLSANVTMMVVGAVATLALQSVLGGGPHGSSSRADDPEKSA